MSVTRPLAQPPGSGADEGPDLSVDIHPEVAPVVEVRGDIDVHSAPWLREELLRVIRQRGSRLLLDLSGVTFLDCAGISVLLATLSRARLDGGWIRVIRPSARARRVISVLGLADVLMPMGAEPDRMTT